MPEPAEGIYFDPEWRITLFAAVMIALMLGLGFWQLERADEKATLAGTWERRQHQAPALLASVWDQPAGSLAYLPVKLGGRFLQDEYFLLDNRINAGHFGYEVLGIVQLHDSPRLALVNRGWIAGDPARMTLPKVPRVSGPVSLTGHVYVAPGPPYLLAEQQLGSGWPKRIQAVEMHKLVPALAAISGGGVFPYPIRVDAGQPGALSVDWQVVNVSPQKHRGYAVQWFGMATILFIFYLLRCSNLWQLLRAARGKQD